MNPNSLYIFALTCFQLQKYTEAEAALLSFDKNFSKAGVSSLIVSNSAKSDAKDLSMHNVPNGAAGYNLLGQICLRTGKTNLAIQYFKHSLTLDSCLWSSYEHLCQLGCDIDPDQFFKLEDKFMYSSTSPINTNISLIPSRGPSPAVASSLASLPFPTFAPSPGTTPVPPKSSAKNLQTTPQTPQVSVSSNAKSNGPPSALHVNVGSDASFVSPPSTPFESISPRANGRKHVPSKVEKPPQVANSVTPLPSRHMRSNSVTSLKKAATSSSSSDITAESKTADVTTPSGRKSSRVAVATRAVDDSVMTPASAATSTTVPPGLLRRNSVKQESKRIKTTHSRTGSTSNLLPVPLFSAPSTPSVGSSASSLAGTSTPAAGTSTSNVAANAPAKKKLAGIAEKQLSATVTPANSVASEMDNLASPISSYPSQAAEFSQLSGAGNANPSYNMPANLRRTRELNKDGTRMRGISDPSDNIPTSSLSQIDSHSTHLSNPSHLSHPSPLPFGLGTPNLAQPHASSSSNVTLSSRMFHSHASKDHQFMKLEDEDNNHYFSSFSSTRSDYLSSSLNSNSTYEQNETSLNEFTPLFRIFARILKLQCTFNCSNAIELANSKLPKHHFLTGWVLSVIGRCYFEMANYPKCISTFQLLRSIEPHRILGLDIYSTALWHLKKDVELSFLAQQAAEMDRYSPETWIIVGNCFSLQKEHDTALKFFRRASQVDNRCAYAYTLSAHEHVANEDFEKAISGYRYAIGVDARHYNAWYGLGNIYFRQEKYDMASVHFSKACDINPFSSVLFCYRGMVLHASKKYDQALTMLDHADKLQPSNPLTKFQKANVYLSQEKYESALKELIEVQDMAPKEASVHFLMGKIYKKLNRLDEALMRFTTALDLDPKDKNLVKSFIEKLNAPNENDDSSDDDFAN
jgi:anaphase-promoting complex subunit 3